ncbi:hypothetical protein B1748_10840 [Paenibacillus sp. MY03]|uniref:hypothetical protein n=1 Tax=Paenibacillus sp. MY03 TaxID=302980 RepID=UPI000B3CCC77|nr:hypothetical protein [Paenibacillus sp. MY03]OUS76588.1 hypothetical protein B1748_10840 [Paenibacillus sp. MY03]
MRQSTAITQFIMEIAFLLDKGVKYSLEEVNRHIEDKNVIEWLEKEHPFGTDIGLDFSMFEHDDRKFIHDGLESYWGGYAGRERRKWGITDNGLCILICWSTEMTRDLLGRS